MILKSITLENYRPYIGPEKIDFAEGEQNITIIEGRNDRGKTCLLNAFTWCLYGREYYRNKGKQQIYNTSVMNNLPINETVSVTVTIEMQDNNDRNIRFIREQEFTKKNKNVLKSEPTFDIFREDENNEESQILLPENYMTTHLPEDLREYFLFDGEQLIKFFSNDEKITSVKNGVYTLSQLDLLKKLEEHMKARKHDLNNQIKSINPNLGDYNIKLDKIKENQDKDDKKIKSNKATIEKFEKLIDKWQNEIKDQGDNPKNIQDEINTLEYEIDLNEKNLEKNSHELTKYLVDNVIPILNLRNTKLFLELSKDLKEKNYIPSPFKKGFLESLLKEKKCICGTVLTEDSECYNELKKLFEETNEITDISDEVNIILGKCEKTIEDYPYSFTEKISEYYSKEEKIEDELEFLNNKLKVENGKLKRLNVDDINSKLDNIEKAKKTIKENTEENGALKRNLENYPNEIKKYEELIEKENENQKILTELKEKKSFCDKIINQTHDMSDRLAMEIHDQLQNITSEEFKNIHWKESYSKIIIDDNFDVLIEKEDGSILDSTDPSSGTQLVLALSFILAINSLSGFKLPLIIDTPLGRLDGDVRENLATYLPQYSKDKQITFIVTDKEYEGEFKKKIKPYVGKKHELKYFKDEYVECTKVI